MALLILTAFVLLLFAVLGMLFVWAGSAACALLAALLTP